MIGSIDSRVEKDMEVFIINGSHIWLGTIRAKAIFQYKHKLGRHKSKSEKNQ